MADSSQCLTQRCIVSLQSVRALQCFGRDAEVEVGAKGFDEPSFFSSGCARQNQFDVIPAARYEDVLARVNNSTDQIPRQFLA